MNNQLSNTTKIGLTILLGVLGSAEGIERPGGAPVEKAPVPAEIVPENNQGVHEDAVKNRLRPSKPSLAFPEIRLTKISPGT